MATVESGGGVVWGPMVDFDEIALGRETKASGELLPHSNAGGGTLLLPATVPTNVSALQLGGAGQLRVVRPR